MGARQKEWAKRARAALVAKLGGECVACGATEQLEFDCIRPQGDRHHRLDPSARMSFYRSQDRHGNLQLLCACHNNRKSLIERPRDAVTHERFLEWSEQIHRLVEAVD